MGSALSDNLIIAKTDFVTESTTTISGSGWTGELPVDNIATPRLSDISRSVNTSASIYLDFGRSRAPTVIAIPSHSLTTMATWRVRFSDNPSIIVNPDSVPLSEIKYDSNTVLSSTYSATFLDLSSITVSTDITLVVSGNLNFFPGVQVLVKDSTLQNYLTGTVVSYNDITRELVIYVTSVLGTASLSSWTVDRYDSSNPIWSSSEDFGSNTYGEFTWGGYLQDDEYTRNNPAIEILNSTTPPARYMSIELDDPTNLDGYFNIGKLVVSPGYRPTLNYEFGWTVEYVDNSSSSRSRAGTLYVDEVPRYRRVKFKINHLGRDEILSNFLDLDRKIGIASPVLVVLDPKDNKNMHRLSIYGSQPKLRAIKNNTFNSYSRELVIEEWL